MNSFQKESKLEDKLIGVWIYNVAEGDQITYDKAKKFKKDVGGIEFKKDGKLINRENMSWCGTEPVTFKNYNGTWKISPDSIITITTEYDRDKEEETLKFVSVDDHTLKVLYIDWHKIEKPVMLPKQNK